MEDDVSDVASHHLRGRNLWVLRVRAEAGDGGHRQPALHVHLELDDGPGQAALPVRGNHGPAAWVGRCSFNR